MKTEQITSPQQEQSIQRNNAQKARHSGKPDAADTQANPFAQLLAGLEKAKGQSDETQDASQETDQPPVDPTQLAAQTPSWLVLAQAQQAQNASTTATLGDTSANPSHKPTGKGLGLLSTADLQQHPRDDRLAPGQLVAVQAHDKEHELPPPLAASHQQTETATDSHNWHMLSPGHPGSALTAETSATAPINSTGADATVLGGVSTATDKTSQPETSPQGQGQGQPGLTGGDSTTGSSSADATAAANQPDSFAQNLDQAMNNLGAQVSYWASQNIRRASMQLDLGRRGPLSVDVRLKDGKASVDFLSNDSQTRDTLQTQAHQQLSHLLQQHGIALEGLSVGSQGAQNQNAYSQADQRGWAPLNPPKLSDSAASSTPVQTTRRTGTPAQGALDEFV